LEETFAGNRADHIVLRIIPQIRLRRTSMKIRARKFIGTIALLVLVCVWGLLAMALAQSVLTNINGFVATIYYVVAGLGWVLPAMPLISWMARPDAPRA
jgi:NhaP-type Na+/H+ or K+/H+ antiporter